MFPGEDVVARGWPTRKQLRSSAWRLLRQDVYADATLPVTHRLMIGAVGLGLPEGAGFVGWRAAVLWGATELAHLDDPVQVGLPPGRRWNTGPGVPVRSLLLGRQLVRRGRWHCTSREDTAIDLARWVALDDGVVLLDRLVHVGVVRIPAVRAAVADVPPCPGSARAREAVRLADGLAESPQETRLRLVLSRAGLPSPVAQFRVFDDAGSVARADFAHPDLKLAIEYDGLWLGERGPRSWPTGHG